eukprot:307108-Hanusia_phi.AAC.2
MRLTLYSSRRKDWTDAIHDDSPITAQAGVRSRSDQWHTFERTIVLLLYKQRIQLHLSYLCTSPVLKCTL